MHLRDCIINEASEVEHRHLRETGVALNSSMNQELIHQ